MDNIQDFFKKLSRKRPRSNSIEDNDMVTRDEYIEYIKDKLSKFMLGGTKTHRQVTIEINQWLHELNMVRQEQATNDAELKLLTQKIHDVTISEKIIYQLLEYVENNKNIKLDECLLMDYLDSLKQVPIKRLPNSRHKFFNNPFTSSADKQQASDLMQVFSMINSQKRLASQKTDPFKPPNSSDDLWGGSDDSDDSDSSYSEEESEEHDEDLTNAIVENKNNMVIEFRIRKNNFLKDWNKRFEAIREAASKNLSMDSCHEYLDKLNPEDREKILSEAERVEGLKNGEKPIYFKILDLPIPLEERKTILREYNSLGRDSHKTKTWLNKILSIPFGVYYKGSSRKAGELIKDLQQKMDSAVYGHNDVKRKIVQIMCQGVRNPNSKGLVMGLEGPPGVGKTVLIEQGICKALERPFIPISLGGASDASFLEGHNFTYEGSIPGKIAESLIQAQCMNPVFYFDELDKVSNTHRGQEIINLLVHLIDPSQNNHFRDKYFHGVNLDLSKATFIFSFNDIGNINPILLDRITVIKTNSLDINDKKIVTKNYLLPSIEKELGLEKHSIKLRDEDIEYLVKTFTMEGGVRKLKEILFHLAREINIYNLTGDKLSGKKVNFPFMLNKQIIKYLTIDFRKNTKSKIHKNPQVGVVNGMYASSMGIGGLTPIEIILYPSTKPFEIKKTGNLKNVIQESIDVSLAVAWNKLSKEKQMYWLDIWKKSCQGFHVHYGDNGTSKDGPSSGSALSLAFYSLLNNIRIPNDYSFTGEINLRGMITAIGGLKSKIVGCKEAGVKKIFYPRENQKDIDMILSKTPLIAKGVSLISVGTFDELLGHVFPKPKQKNMSL